MNRDNLIKLRDGLAKLPEDYKHFGMADYYGGLSKEHSNLTLKEAGTVAPSQCGAVACALGHAPSMVEPAVDGEDWTEYSARVFGILACSAVWDWIFSPDWADYDNTPAGVVSRIDYYLAHGVPKEFRGCYKYEKGLAVYQGNHDK